MGESFKEQDFLGDFKETAKFCGFCKEYCETSDSKGENVHSRQARIYLSAIKNPLTYFKIAKNAYDACRECKGESTRIISILESSEIKDLLK